MNVQARMLMAASLLVAAPAFAAEPAAAPALATQPAAAAGTQQAAAQPTAIDKADPVICRRQQEIGSLLKTKKVCLTKSQWEEQRQVNRSNIEQSQIQRGMDPVQ